MNRGLCRVCLVENVKMYPLINNELQNLYEKLANEKVKMDNLPETLCYICHALLKKCYNYAKTAHESNRILLQYSKDKLSTTTLDRTVVYSKSSIKHYSIDDLHLMSKVEVKVEPFDLECGPTGHQDDTTINTMEHDDKTGVFVAVDNADTDDNADPETSDDELLLPRLQIFNPQGPVVKKRQLKEVKRLRHMFPPFDKKYENANRKNKKQKSAANKSKKERSLDETVVLSKKRITCNVCLRTFATRSSFTTHFRIHTGEKPFSCPLCDYKCRRKYNLDIHSRVHNGHKPYNCHLCDYKCSIKKNLNRHLLVHTGEKPFSCDLCDSKFTQNSSLTCHKMRLHSTERPFSCDSCDHNFVRKQDLEVHKAVHFSGKTPRERRNNSVSKKPKAQTAFLCHICDYKCSTKTVLNVHINAHNGIKPFACDMCDFKCTWKGTLKAHMRRHTGEKPFLCHMCDFKCAQKCNLVTHIRTHTGEKAYSCDLCDYKSTQGSHMKQHKKIHTGEKGFECSMCNYKCSYKQRLDKHVMSVHKKDIKPDLDRT